MRLLLLFVGYGGWTVLVTMTVAVSVTPAAVTVTETVAGSQMHAPLLPGGGWLCPGRVALTVCWLVMALVSVVVESGSLAGEDSGTFCCMAVGAADERLLIIKGLVTFHVINLEDLKVLKYLGNENKGVDRVKDKWMDGCTNLGAGVVPGAGWKVPISMVLSPWLIW